jgi:hypothetical protein
MASIFWDSQGVSFIKILTGFTAQFSAEKSRGPGCVTGLSHLKMAEKRLKTCHMRDDREHL